MLTTASPRPWPVGRPIATHDGCVGIVTTEPQPFEVRTEGVFYVHFDQHGVTPALGAQVYFDGDRYNCVGIGRALPGWGYLGQTTDEEQRDLARVGVSAYACDDEHHDEPDPAPTPYAEAKAGLRSAWGELKAAFFAAIRGR